MESGSVVRAGLRWSWVIVLTIVIGSASAYALSMMLPRVYEADTTLLVGSLTVTDPSERLGYQQLAQTYASVASTNLVLQGAVDALGLDTSVGDVRDRITAETPGALSLVLIRASAPTAEEAAELASAVAEEVVEISSTGAEPAGGLAVVIEGAEIADSPSSPRVTLNVGVGAGLGLMAGLLLVYLLIGQRVDRRAIPSGPWGPQAARPPQAPPPPLPRQR